MADEQKNQGENSEDIKEVVVPLDSKLCNDKDLIEDNTDDKSSIEKDIDDDPQFHSAEEDGGEDDDNDLHPIPNVEIKSIDYKKTEEEYPTELIDEDGGGEGIAETVEIEKEFLDKELLDVSEDIESNDRQKHTETEEKVQTTCSKEVKKEKEICFQEEKGLPKEKITVSSVEEKAVSSVEKKAVSSVKEKAVSSVKEKAASSAEEKTASSAEEKAASSAAEKAASSAEEKAASSVEEKAASSIEEKAASSIEEKAASSIEEKAASSIEEKAVSSVEGKAMPFVQEKTSCNLEKEISYVEDKAMFSVEEKSSCNLEKENESYSQEEKTHSKETSSTEENELVDGANELKLPSSDAEGIEKDSNDCDNKDINVEGEYDEEGEEDGEEYDDDYEDEDEIISDDEDDEEGCVDGDEGTFAKGERQQGDGEECDPVSAADKELDFDEDRRNPQYIPKKGIFYEHDDRIIEAPKEPETDISRDKKKKKLWSDDGKWGHDRYREDEQIPKSRDELIEVYGYDIRCEDGPPRARRRRRYGRGPTKYEPNWEEENMPIKERTLGMFIRRGSRGGRVRGRFRGGVGPNRGTGRPYNKPENENIMNNNNETIKPYEKKNYHSFPPKLTKENLTALEADFAKPNLNRPKKEVNLCGWEDEFPSINVSTQKKTVNLKGEELENFQIVSGNIKEKKKETEENLCGWESEEETKPTKPPKKTENLSGWESDEETKHVKPKNKEENLCGWESDEETKHVQPKKEENFSGWESEHNQVDKPIRSAVNNKEFSSYPVKEVPFQTSPNDRNSAYTRRKPSFNFRESQDKSSVRTQTFENSSYSNNRNSFPSYEKPPRHEGLRGPPRGSRRTIRGRPMRSSGDRYSNNNNHESYIKPTVGPRLLDKQMNRVNTELERLNLSNRNESRDNTEAISNYEQKQNINIKGSVNRQNNTVLSSKNEDSASRSKRYSHMRQKTIPETSNFQASQNIPTPHAPYFETGYQAALYASDTVTPSPQPPSSASPPVISPPQYQQYNPSPYPEGFRVPIPVNNTQRLYPQVTVPAGQPINMTPSPCITPAANLMNFPAPPAAQPPYPPQYAYQQYPQPPPPPPPPVDWQDYTCNQALGYTNQYPCQYQLQDSNWITQPYNSKDSPSVTSY